MHLVMILMLKASIVILLHNIKFLVKLKIRSSCGTCAVCHPEILFKK